MPLTPASRLGPYEILDLLGSGGIGDVYRARDSRLGRQVAIKVLSDRLCTDAELLRRFQREAQAAGALNHPNVVSVYDVGHQDGVHYVVSELVDGETLRSRLASGPLPEPVASDLSAQIARGLSAAHDQGVVHRDLKPENVMVTRDGRAKILDFGVAKIDPPLAALDAVTVPPSETRPTLPGVVMGTVAYMSPEQVRGDNVDLRSDIFSLGVLFYEMVAGVRPFEGRTSAELIAAILRDDPPPLPQIAPGLQAVIRRCLEKSREARFSSLAEFGQALIQASAPPEVPGRSSLAARARTAQPERTIAVLPFADVGAGSESEYFSDGLTEELIHELTRVHGLRVVAWQSAAKLKGLADDVQAVARQLGASAALVGSVRRSGDRVRITARLVDAATGVHRWSRAYDRQIQDLFAVQEDIAREIVATLAESLSLRRSPASTRRPGSAESYTLYLKGRFHWNKRTEEGLRASVLSFNQAIAADPASALGYAGLADALCLLVDYGFMRTGEAMPRASEAAQKALELDPHSAEAHASYGMIRALYDWEWNEAEAFFLRALELNPGYATAHHWYGIDFLASLGRFAEAHDEIDRAHELDPLSQIILEGHGYLLMLERRYDEAIEAYRGLLDLDASFYKAFTSMGRAMVQKGDYPGGIAMLEKGRAMVGDVPSILGALGQASAMAGDRARARDLLNQLNALARSRYVPTTSLALIHAGLGEHEKALDWLERGCDLRELPLSSLKVHPAYDVLRSEPRFDVLLRRLRLGG
jgi:TolB-like protein/Tfp pilus assembly protein PilF